MVKTNYLYVKNTFNSCILNKRHISKLVVFATMLVFLVQNSLNIEKAVFLRRLFFADMTFTSKQLKS
jgi:hypothetical protein